MTKIQRLLKMPTVLLGTALLATSCAGTVGSAGSAGAQGPAGPQGPQGLTGAIGSTGPQGPVGPAGPQGLAGAQGPRGFSGSDGSQGSNGLSAYQIYTAEYPGYLTLTGASQANWINDLASNKLFNAIQFDYTSQTDFAADFVEPTHAAVFKGQTTAQKSLASLFGSLVNESGRTSTIAAYNLEFFSNSNRDVAVNPTTYVYGTHTIIYVKATLIGITSIVLKNGIDSALDVTATVSGAGFALTVPYESAAAYSNKFTHYLATTNYAVKSDGKVYSNQAATQEHPGFLVMRDGLTGTGSNLATDLISSTSTARTSFSIWQNSGDAVPPGGYLSFATSGTFTVYLRIIYSDSSERIVPLIITVAADTTAPTVTFSPANSAINVAVSANITITFNEAVKLANGTILENSNLASIITLKQTSSSGTDIPFTATINAAKKVITIDPTSNLTANTVYYVAISAGVEDTFGNEISLTSVSFTTA
jgi:hypothetical protein